MELIQKPTKYLLAEKQNYRSVPKFFLCFYLPYGLSMSPELQAPLGLQTNKN